MFELAKKQEETKVAEMKKQEAENQNYARQVRLHLRRAHLNQCPCLGAVAAPQLVHTDSRRRSRAVASLQVASTAHAERLVRGLQSA